jgi:tRNA-dihydrouridine synthase
MIGRGALRTPWIFRLAADLLRMSVPDPSLLREPSTSDKLAMIRRHLALLESHHYSERHAIHMMKLRMGWYGKTIPNAKPLRESFRTAPSIRVMRDALSEFEQLQRSATSEVDASYPLQTSLSKLGDRL